MQRGELFKLAFKLVHTSIITISFNGWCCTTDTQYHVGASSYKSDYNKRDYSAYNFNGFVHSINILPHLHIRTSAYLHIRTSKLDLKILPRLPFLKKNKPDPK